MVLDLFFIHFRVIQASCFILEMYPGALLPSEQQRGLLIISRVSFLAVFELRTFDLDSVKHMSKGKITQDYKKLCIKSLV